MQKRRHSDTLGVRPRYGFDQFIDVIERRAFRIAMLIVLLLWLGEKVRDTAVASQPAHFTPRSRVESQTTGRRKCVRGSFCCGKFETAPEERFLLRKRLPVLESDCRREIPADCLSSRKFGG